MKSYINKGIYILFIIKFNKIYGFSKLSNLYSSISLLNSSKKLYLYNELLLFSLFIYSTFATPKIIYFYL